MMTRADWLLMTLTPQQVRTAIYRRVNVTCGTYMYLTIIQKGVATLHNIIFKFAYLNTPQKLSLYYGKG